MPSSTKTTFPTPSNNPYLLFITPTFFKFMNICMSTFLYRTRVFKFLIAIIPLLHTGINSKAQSFVISNCSEFNWVLAVPCGNYVNNQQLIIWNFSDTLGDQKFQLYKRPNGGIMIRPYDKPNMAIGIPNCIIEQNKPLILWECNNNLDQQWELQQIKGMKYIIRSCLNRDYVLAPLTGNLDARIVIQKYTGAEHQQWVIMSTTGEFYNNIFKPLYSK